MGEARAVLRGLVAGGRLGRNEHGILRRRAVLCYTNICMKYVLSVQ